MQIEEHLFLLKAVLLIHPMKQGVTPMGLSRKTDITPIVKELQELQEQLPTEFQQIRAWIKSVVTETQSVKKELEEIKSVLIDIRDGKS